METTRLIFVVLFFCLLGCKNQTAPATSFGNEDSIAINDDDTLPTVPTDTDVVKTVYEGPKYTMDATSEEIRKIQGEPDQIVSQPKNMQVWKYGKSELNLLNGTIYSYNSIDKQLHIRYYGMEVSKELANDATVKNGAYFFQATKKQVFGIQGTPDRVEKPAPDQEIWYYGGSTVTFRNGKMTDYRNTDQNLDIRP